MEGFRKLVSLLETTPLEKRRKMLEVGMKEDPAYTTEAVKYLMNFADILALQEMELSELLARAPLRIVALSIHPLSEEVRKRFLHHAPRKKQADLKLMLEGSAPSLSLVGGAQLQMVGHLRELEKNALIRFKRIPDELKLPASPERTSA